LIQAIQLLPLKLNLLLLEVAGGFLSVILSHFVWLHHHNPLVFFLLLPGKMNRIGAAKLGKLAL
jgi:heme/copper-type cytochrome/quinol oxidase subunit 1